MAKSCQTNFDRLNRLADTIFYIFLVWPIVSNMSIYCVHKVETSQNCVDMENN